MTYAQTPTRSEFRRRLFAFSLYDFGDSGFAITILSVLFNQYYSKTVVGPEGISILGTTLPGATLWAWWISLSMTVVALLGPVLGALADREHGRVRFLAWFWLLGVAWTLALFTVDPGEWLSAGVLFALAYIAYAASSIFYNALLPLVAPRAELGRASGLAWGIGYLGGSLLLVLNLLMLTRPSLLGFPAGSFRIQHCFASAGLWWLVFTIPLLVVFGRLESRARGALRLPSSGLVTITRAAFRQASRTARQLARERNLLRFFFAYLLYNDGVQTIVAMASIFGAEELGMTPTELIVLFLGIQGTAFIGSVVLGAAADRVGPKATLFVCIAAFTLVTLWASFVGIFGDARLEYWILSCIAGLFLGGIQSVSRSWIAEWIPPGREAELYGFFSIMTRVAAIFGPLVYGALVLATGSLRQGILSVTLFFVAGGWLLATVRRGEIEAERARLQQQAEA